MAIDVYSVQSFLGVDMTSDESLLSFSVPYARNIDTKTGRIMLAKGFTKHILHQEPVPGEDEIDKLCVFHTNGKTYYLVMAGPNIYCTNTGTWSLIHTFSGSALGFMHFCLEAQINGQDYLIIGNGMTQMVKFDGESVTPFGSEELLSNIPAGCAAMYENRLFLAGDASHKNRLYWSKLPGSGRTIEDFGVETASENVSGGHVEVGDCAGDPISAIIALQNQLLIFKQRSIYRLTGDRPSNFIIEKVCEHGDFVYRQAFVRMLGTGYYMTKHGLHSYNGINAHRMSDADAIKPILGTFSPLRCKGAFVGDMLYFAIGKGAGAIIVEYDTTRSCYMIRDGFGGARDLISDGDYLLMINDKRYIYRMNSGYTYDGEPIHASFRTPRISLNGFYTIKQPRRLFMCAGMQKDEIGEPIVPFPTREFDRGVCGEISVTAHMDDKALKRTVLISDEAKDRVTEVPLFGSGRLMCLEFQNEDGSAFSLSGGIQLEFLRSWRTE